MHHFTSLPRTQRNRPEPARRRETHRWEKVGAGHKPGSVVDSHSSGTSVTGRLVQPTRVRCGPHHAPLFGLAPDGVYPATNCYQSRGALLPHHFTLTCARRPSAVYFLRHFPSARAAQVLPGVLPCGARTFLHIRGCSDCPADSRAPCTPPRHGTQGFSGAWPPTPPLLFTTKQTKARRRALLLAGLAGHSLLHRPSPVGSTRIHSFKPSRLPLKRP